MTARTGRGLRSILVDALRLGWLRLWAPRAVQHGLEFTSPWRAWQAANQFDTAAERVIRDNLEKIGRPAPLISIVMPVYRPNLPMLDLAITSVIEQIYGQWQLCIHDDGSDDFTLTRFLRERAAADARIVIRSSPVNTGISSATNASAELARGEFILFLDQDDTLTRDCLARLVIAVDQYPDADLLYSDHDKIDQRNRYVAPNFKPGWSPTLLLSYMYLGHFMAVRTTLFRSIGGMRMGYEGSQDYDFALRATEQARRVLHIPHILYHWRMLPGSTAVSASAKPASIAAAHKAIADALDRRRIAASVDWPDWAMSRTIGLFTLRFADTPPVVTQIVVLTRNADSQLRALQRLSSGLASSSQLVVALASEAVALHDAQIAEVAGSAVRCLRAVANETMGALLNRAAAFAHNPFLVICVGEIEPMQADWRSVLCGYASLPHVGMAAPRLLDHAGTVKSAGLVKPSRTSSVHHAFAGLSPDDPSVGYLARTARECLAALADCIVLETEKFRSSGMFCHAHDSLEMLGLGLSRCLRDKAALETVIVGECKMRTARQMLPAFPRLQVDGATRDQWYNGNLAGAGHLFEPAPFRQASSLRRPMKAVFVTHSLEREGAPIVLLDLARALTRRGEIGIIFIAPESGPLVGEVQEMGLEIRYCRAPRNRASLGEFRSYVDDLAGLIQDIGPDVVVANTLPAHAAILAADEAGVPSIWWQHEGGRWQDGFPSLRPRRRALAFAAFGMAYAVVHVSEASLRNWQWPGRKNNSLLVRHGLPLHWLASQKEDRSRKASRDTLGLADEDIVLISVGSICARKSQADIVAALALLPDLLAARVKMFLIGSPVEDRYLACIKREIDRLPGTLRERVQIMGAREDVGLFYAAADIYVCSSREESAPRAIAEAMAFALPVVTTPVDGIVEMVSDGVEGLHFSPGDVRQLASCLERLVKDPRLRQSLAQAAGLAMQEVSSHEAMVDRFDALLRESAETRRV